MKSAVYSWRLDPEKKADLEEELRREGMTLSKLLDNITSDWLRHRRNRRGNRDAEQAALRKRVMATVGAIRSGDPDLASKSREIIRERILRKHLQELNGSGGPD
jgi:hypothetical protein